MRPSTFEEFTARTFSPRLPLPSNEEIDTTDNSVHRTFSVPSRVNVVKDTSAALTRLLDLPDKSFRDRTSTGFHQPTSSHGKHSWDGKLCKYIFCVFDYDEFQCYLNSTFVRNFLLLLFR